MGKPSDIQIKQARCSGQQIRYRTPIKFGGRVVTDVVLLDVEVDIETRDGRRATGGGSMPVGNAWAWPSPTYTSEQTLAAMLQLGQQLVQQADQHRQFGHPLELTSQLAESHPSTARQVMKQLEQTHWQQAASATQQAATQQATSGTQEASGATPEEMPRLAQLVAASPLEAAIHDGYGKALQVNSYDLLGPEHVNADLAEYLTNEFAGQYLDRYTSRLPKPQMPLYHLVGALDPLTPSDIERPLNDGLPETLGQWILADGLTHLKIKLAGDDMRWDLDRVLAIDRVSAETQQQRGCTRWFYSLDFNERCANVDYVVGFLEQLRENAPEALERVQYIEQPTHRDLRANPENRMHEAAMIKPVVIDESLIDLESLLLAREQGYSGVALKTCKGHSEALLMGAAAQHYQMFLCVQDLTCPGYSFLHSASLAARIPTVAAIEGNARQYCPAGNAGWTERYPGMFKIHDGTVKTEVLQGVGLF